MVKIVLRKIFLVVICILCVSVIYNLINGDICDLGDSYSYSSEADHILGNSGAIPPHILEYKYNKQFIIAKQKLNGMLPDKIYYDMMSYNYPELEGIYYWIVDKKQNIFYGPMDSDEFKNKCKLLNIQMTLN